MGHGESVAIRCGKTPAKKRPWLDRELSMREIRKWKAALYPKKIRKKAIKK